MYVDSTVAFLDILGFKEFIARSQSDIALLTRVRDALDVLMRFERIQRNAMEGNLVDGTYSQGFSDNIVIVGNFSWVIGEVAALSQKLLEVGFPVRGGIVVGKIYCSDRIVFGPALVRAVAIEKHVAVFPRVVIERLSIPSLGRDIPVFRDADGEDFVDFLAPPSPNREERKFSYSRCMAVARNLIVDSLERFSGDPDKLEKYDWLARYFNSIVSKQNLTWVELIEIKNASSEASGVKTRL